MTSGVMNGFDFVPGAEVEDGDEPVVGKVVGSMFSRLDAMWTIWADGRQQDVSEWTSLEMSEMLRRYHQGRVVENVLTLPLQQLTYKITPAKGDRGESEWLNDWIARPANLGGMSTPMDQIQAQMLSAITHKRAFFEKVFKVSPQDGAHVYDSVQFRSASTCVPVRDPETAAFAGFAQEPLTRKQIEKSKGLPLRIDPKYAFVYFHDIKHDPVNGASDMEIPYWCYKTQQKILFLYFNFLETSAMGKTIVEASDLGRATQIATQVRTLKGSGVLPVANTSGANQKIYNLEQDKAGAAHFLEAIRYLDHAASQSAMSGFVDLTDVGAGSGRGSYGLSRDASDFFLMSRQAVAQEMAYFIRNFLLADLIYYKFGTDAAVPVFAFEPLARADMDKAMTLLGEIVAAPQLNVPDELVRQLAVLVGTMLELDIEKLNAAFEDAKFKAQREAANQGANQQTQQVAGVATVTNMAARLVKKGQSA